METKLPYADLDSPRSAPSTGGGGMPGKRSMTQGMAPRTVIYRAADGTRDANGVAADAETAVARASGGSGAPLPTRVQRQFEQSLGTDLSGVRVHTGADSAQAASAVGAKAYTVGNDIHFADGRYQPDDPFGLHLLAHEVAHTAQQSGGAKRRQHKLEVSAPQDAAEHEADRAADAMVAGRPADISGAPTGVSRADDLTQAATRGEDEMTDQLAHPATAVMHVSNVNDRASATQLVNYIKSQEADLHTGVSHKEIDASVLTANAQCVDMLSAYLEAAETQSVQINTFQGMFGRLMKDFGRLNAMAQQFDGHSLSDLKDTKDAAAYGDTQRKEIFLGDDPLKETARIKLMDPQITTALQMMKSKKTLLLTQGKDVTSGGNDVATALSGLANKQRTFSAKATSVKSAEAIKALQDAKRRAANDYTAQVGAVIKDALVAGVGDLGEAAGGAYKNGVSGGMDSGFSGVAGVAGGALKSAGGAAALGALTSVWSNLVQPQIDKALENLEISVGNFPDNSAESDQVAADLAAWAELQALASQITTDKNTVRQKADALGNKYDAYMAARSLYQSEMIALGQKMDQVSASKGPNKGARYEPAMQFLSEADRFIIQAEVTKQQGESELTVKKNSPNAATKASTALHNATNSAERPSVYYTCYLATRRLSDGSEVTLRSANPTNFTLRSGINPAEMVDGSPDDTHRYGAAEGGDGMGANPVIAEHLKKIDDAKAKIAAYRASLGSAIGV